MRGFTFILLFLSLTLSSANLIANEGEGVLDFTPNLGQWEEDFLFKSRMKDGGSIFLESDAFTFLYFEEAKFSWLHHNSCVHTNNEDPSHNDYCQDPEIGQHAYQMQFLDANSAAICTGKDKRKYHENYFLGNNPNRWKGSVPVFSRVHYNDLFDNIDLEVYSQGNILKYDYIIQPGGEIEDIKVTYKGLDDIYIDGNGNLILVTSINQINEMAPYAYQFIDGEINEVSIKYSLEGNQSGFQILSTYQNDIPLIIDPALIASTYTGFTADNWGYTATYDNSGNMYSGGVIFGPGFPGTLGGYDQTYNGSSIADQTVDIAISKFNPSGTNMIWRTYLGGSGSDAPHSLIVDDSEQLTVYGTTSSTNFPSTIGPNFQGGFQVVPSSINYENGSDIILTKFNTSGSALINSRYFGGSGNDGLNTTGNLSLEFNYGDYARGDIEIDANGDLILASCTYSTDIPNTNGHFQPQSGGALDGLIAKFNSDLSSISWVSYFGGFSFDAAYDVEIEQSGSYLIAGGTQSTNLNGLNGLHSGFQGGSSDGYLLRIDQNGNTIQNGSYIGTNAYDQTFFVDTDEDGSVYTFGQTLGIYPVTNGVWSITNASQFIHKLSPDLNSTIYSTTFGTPNGGIPSQVNLSPTAFQVDKCENVLLYGLGVADQILLLGMLVV